MKSPNLLSALHLGSLLSRVVGVAPLGTMARVKPFVGRPSNGRPFGSWQAPFGEHREARRSPFLQAKDPVQTQVQEVPE
jgi:hypothetical protein